MKKFISTALSAVLLLSSAVVTVNAAIVSNPDVEIEEPDTTVAVSAVATDDKALEQAIKTIKSRIKIPDEYVTFNFNKYAQYGKDIYNLSWERNDGVYGYISATVSGSIILSYNTYSENKESKAHFAKLSVDSLYSKASGYLKQLNPDVYSEIKIDKDSYNSYISGDYVNFGINRMADGIPVDGNGGSINLNKDTGELRSFDISWAVNFKVKDVSKLLTQEQIKAQYTKLVGLEPYYRINYNENGGKTAVLLYRKKNASRLDALTGKVSDFNTNYYGGYGIDTAESEAAADMNPRTGGDAGSGEIKLTPAELKAVQTEKGFISATAAANIIFKDKYNAITSDTMELQSSNLYNYDRNDDKAFNWALSFKDKNEDYSSMGAAVNAATGEIVSFYDYTYTPYEKVNESEKKFSEKTSDSNVEAALKSYLGERFSEYRLESGTVNTLNEYYNSKSSVKSGKNYWYNRYVNDIKVDNDYINVQTNYTGKLTNFNYIYSDVEFPSPEKVMAESKALTELYKAKDLTLAYSLNMTNSGAVTSALLYTMPDFIMDAFTGKLVNWDGSAIVDETGYSDLEGHSAKKMVETLKQNGIELPAIDGKLMPDSMITEGDFINLVSRIYTDWNDFYYGYQIRLNESEKMTLAAKAGTVSSSIGSSNSSAVANTALSDKITRQDAVKCIITSLGGKKFAELKGVYKSPYSDVADNNGYVGYFSLADGMGIVKANSSGKILPKNTITRAQALKMIYNYLSNN